MRGAGVHRTSGQGGRARRAILPGVVACLTLLAPTMPVPADTLTGYRPPDQSFVRSVIHHCQG